MSKPFTSSINAIHYIRHHQVFGPSVNRVNQLHEKFVAERQLVEREMLGYCRCIDTQLSTGVWCLETTLKTLQDVYNSIYTNELVEYPIKSRIFRQKTSIYLELLESFGYFHMLINVLMYLPDVYPFKSSDIFDSTQRDKEMIKKVCFMILHLLRQISGTTKFRGLAMFMGKDESFLRTVFKFLQEKMLAITAMSLLEDLIVTNSTTVDIKNLGIPALFKTIEYECFTNLCRVLSYTVVDFHTEQEELLQAIDETQKQKPLSLTQCERNQRYLAEIPGFVERLVEVITKDYLLDSHELILDYLEIALNAFENTRSEGNQHTISSLRLANLGMDSNHVNSYNLLKFLQHQERKRNMAARIEALVLLIGLLCCESRQTVLSILMECKLIPRISSIFDKVFFPRQRYVSDLYNAEQSINELLHSMQMQLLRLISSIGDKHFIKYVMLSSQECDQLQFFQEHLHHLSIKCSVVSFIELPASIEYPERSKLCSENPGLLSRLIEQMKKEGIESGCGFWLSRAVESFLRGPVSPADQEFLLRRGLIEHCCDTILHLDQSNLPSRRSSDEFDSGKTFEDFLQCSFDLLGEVIKLNFSAFCILNECLSDDYKFQILINRIYTNVIDSNMFIRRIVISLDYFHNQGDLYDTMSHHLLRFFSSDKERINFVCCLIESISVETLTTENVSCLNTAVIFLLIADLYGKLPLYLLALAQYQSENLPHGQFLVSFRNMLFFWKSHYTEDSSDAESLQNSTGIHLSHWQVLIESLLDNDECSALSIGHYLSMR